MKRKGLQELRYLHDDTQTQVTMLLVGYGAQDVISAHADLDSRVTYKAPFQLLNGVELVEVLRQLHPLLESVAEQTLLDINDAWGSGNLRKWQRFLDAAEHISPTSSLDDETIDVVLAMLNPRSAAQRGAA